ncbi:hypothetical protein KY330_05080 [Candidatus Woesearchaeota archaeon]|nr:hypothetical protein [Candidatus Woesearchaeota archaeon]
MTNMKRTWLLTYLVATFSASVAYFVQKNGEKVANQCSYLDPITIDIFAFSAAVFLIIEGVWRIVEHRGQPLRKQFTRTLRVGFGFAIATIHILQFIHK